MPSRSHGRCKVCRAIIHSSHRFGMCQRCSDKHNARIAAERREIKKRRARREAAVQAALAAQPVLEEGPAMTDIEEPNTPLNTPPVPGKPGRPHKGSQITDEQAVEILDAYTQTDEAVQSISARYGIKDTYIYNVLNRVGVTWRRGNPESYMTWQSRQAQPRPEPEPDPAEPVALIPDPQQKALERMLRPVEPISPAVDITRRPPLPRIVEPVLHWQIKVQGVLDAYYPTLEEAVASVRKLQPGVRITGIELVED